jgi:type I restriction enzyme R subunit
VLDFANEPEEIQKGFQPYYEKTMLSGATDPNKLYDIENELLAFGVFSPKDVDAFGARYFDPNATQDVLYGYLAPLVARAMELRESERKNLRGKLIDFVRLYSFLAQILPFTDSNLEKLYVFSRLLFRYIPKDPRVLPQEIKDQIDMESYRVHLTSAGSIGLDRGAGIVKPATSEKGAAKSGEEDLLSRILSDLNERFGTDFTPEDRIVIASLEEELRANESLATSVRVNTKENARLAFDHVVTDRLQGLVDKNFKFYKKITDDKEFAKAFLDILFARFVKQAREDPSAGG